MKLALPHPWIFSLALTLSATAVPPRYDHVVIVIEENHSFTQIIGNRTSAPYINQLADGGVSFARFYAVTHPSQPNYLEFFSGSNQDVVDDSRPRNPDGTLRYPFSTPNLGAELIAAGASFIGYSEDLPVGGDADTSGVNTVVNGVTYSLYRRKHNPWANWQDPTQGPDPVDPPPPNRLRPSTNQPFTSFPSDFTQLPDVAIVVPNEQNDMHDGTVRMGDDWLAAHFSDYAEWAKTHNSLLIVTWDEDNFSGPNRIPTIFYGANLRSGINATTWTLHNLQRMLEGMIGTTHAGAAANVEPISGVFASELPAGFVKLQQGVSGYTGVHDTQIRADMPTTTFGEVTRLMVDLDDNAAPGDQPVQTLIRFDAIASRIPAGAPILSAKLLLATGVVSGDTSVTAVRLHRMLVDWDETATWDGFIGGIAADGVKASATADFALKPTVLNAPAIFDVTNAVRDWLNGGTNRGWVLLSTSADGWRFSSSEEMTASLRPTLEVTYASSVNLSPNITIPAAAVPALVTGTTTALSVAASDDKGEPALTYTWSVNGDVAAPIVFSANGTNAAQSTTGTFSKAGLFTLTVIVRDAEGLTATGSVEVQVNQTFTAVTVAPASATVGKNATQQFTGAARDQFGDAFATQPSFSWSASGGGSIAPDGTFTASTVGGPFTVTATSGAFAGNASVTVTGQTFTSWQVAYFTAAEITAGLAADTADPDFDGLANLLEYTLGTDPRTATALPVTALNATGHLTLTLTRPKSLPGVSYFGEATGTLGSWPTSVPLEIITDGDPQTIRLTDPLGTADTTQHFLRLRITTP